MDETVIKYIGILHNVDSSIMKLQMEHGFQIEKLSSSEGITLLRKLENMNDDIQLARSLFPFQPCISEDNSLYIITNEIRINEKKEDPMDTLTHFGNTKEQGYLQDIVRKLRLFKEGNICLSRNYYCFEREHGEINAFITSNISKKIVRGPTFKLTNLDIKRIESFLKDIDLEMKKSYLQISLDNFELSYDLENNVLSFLVLMISLEAMFNRGAPEVKYSVSRNAAVLLGKSLEESEIIYRRVGNYYKMRSKLVHSGESIKNKIEDVVGLRDIVRQSLLKLISMNLEKGELVRLLTIKGFDEIIE